MLSEDEDALICDLAETYGIFDYEALPPNLVAALCSGLRESSRIFRRMRGTTLSLEQLLLAEAVDRLGLLLWQRTKDGARGRNRPASILRLLTKTPDEKPRGFASPEAFEEAWKRATEGK